MKPNDTTKDEDVHLNALYLIKKKYLQHYHLMLFSVLCIHGFIFYFEGNNNIAVSIFGFALFIVVVTIVIYKLDYYILRHLITYYIVVDIFLLNIMLFAFWRDVPEVSLYILLIPLGIYNFYSFKKVICWTVLILMLFIVVILLPDHYYPNILQKPFNAQLNSIKVIFTFFTIGLFLLYYNILISKVKSHLFRINNLNSATVNTGDEATGSSVVVNEKNTTECYSKLYDQILDYFQNEPWKDPDFTVQDLAESLNTNATYISRAININTGINFKTFVNRSRINFVKDELIKDDNYNRYTLMYIYTSAGFRHQSTFNKTFKQFENMTPSEFINSVTKKEMPDLIEEMKVVGSSAE